MMCFISRVVLYLFKGQLKVTFHDHGFDHRTKGLASECVYHYCAQYLVVLLRFNLILPAVRGDHALEGDNGVKTSHTSFLIADLNNSISSGNAKTVTSVLVVQVAGKLDLFDDSIPLPALELFD